MRALETIYDGCHFRSRLEARWAVFFRYLKVPYEYEKQGFDLGDSVFYLPDFWLPVQQCWIEIKGKHPSDRELDRTQRIAEQSGFRAYVFFGDIPYPYPDFSNDNAIAVRQDMPWDNHYAWCQCALCKALGIEFEGRSARLECGCQHQSDQLHTYDAPIIREAYFAARSKRFEV